MISDRLTDEQLAEILSGAVDGMEPTTQELAMATELQELRKQNELQRGELLKAHITLLNQQKQIQKYRNADSAEPDYIRYDCGCCGWETIEDWRENDACPKCNHKPMGKTELYTAPPASEREQIRRDHAEWSDKTFGDVGPIGPLKHLSKEALEAAANPEDPLEWADMQFLLWDAQRRMGLSDEFITRAMIEKLAINKARQWPEPKDGEPRLHIKEQPAPVVPDGLRQALSNAGIAAPESDEMLAATCEKYIQMLVTWVKDRKPFQPAPVVPEVLERLRSIVADPRALPRRKEWISGQQYSNVLLENVEAMVEEACRAAMLKTEPATAPVISPDLHPDTQKLVTDFCTALAEKLYKAQLKYGYDADWKQDGWHTQCLAHFHQHIAKGDPRDVAAYCAFMWYHGWKTESVSVPVVPDAYVRDECGRMMLNGICEPKIGFGSGWNACRAAMFQSKYRDLSQPIDPQVAEYEKIMLQAGNSPENSDG